ncbi:spore germination protein GerPC [Paenibacillus sp. SYP-B4298]|uniref:spore germination protein GerPC n=1 Tax=Paenibacillus sp. SYP-B4298 TaxID=2996034 RepID=UPI0022DDEEBB|nr:spore germination protein GerPC [Paenibacillus sp. SYP-B4298]
MTQPRQPGFVPAPHPWYNWAQQLEHQVKLQQQQLERLQQHAAAQQQQMERLLQQEAQQRLQIERLEQQAERQQQLVAELLGKVKQAADKPTYTIERLEYHFDQLKVQRLDGTLHIGMAMPGESDLQSSIEQLQVPGAPAAAAADDTASAGEAADAASSASSPSPADAIAPSPLYNEAYRRVNQYLNVSGPGIVSHAAADRGIILDPYHQSLIIEDMRRQLSPRIQYYTTAVSKASQEGGATTIDEQADQVAQMTIRDLEMAITNYIGRLPQLPASSASAPASPPAEADEEPVSLQHSGVTPFGKAASSEEEPHEDSY